MTKGSNVLLKPDKTCIDFKICRVKDLVFKAQARAGHKEKVFNNRRGFWFLSSVSETFEAGGLGGASSPPAGSRGRALVGDQGVKPPEDFEFLHYRTTRNQFSEHLRLIISKVSPVRRSNIQFQRIAFAGFVNSVIRTGWSK